MVYCWSAVGQGIDSGSVRHRRSTRIVDQLKRLSRHIPFEHPKIYFDYRINRGDGASVSVSREEYLAHHLTEFSSELSDLVVTGNITVDRIKRHLLDRLYEFAEDNVDDALLNQDVTAVIRYLRAIPSSRYIMSIKAFEDFESRLYRDVLPGVGH